MVDFVKLLVLGLRLVLSGRLSKLGVGWLRLSFLAGLLRGRAVGVARVTVRLV